jgi:hypothetical protein
LWGDSLLLTRLNKEGDNKALYKFIKLGRCASHHGFRASDIIDTLA